MSVRAYRYEELVAMIEDVRAEAWDKGHRSHMPVIEFGETPCDCENPYRERQES